MFGLGLTELFIVLLIVLILFGGKRLPEIARGLKRGIVNFGSALHDEPKDETETSKETPQSK